MRYVTSRRNEKALLAVAEWLWKGPHSRAHRLEDAAMYYHLLGPDNLEAAVASCAIYHTLMKTDPKFSRMAQWRDQACTSAHLQ